MRKLVYIVLCGALMNVQFEARACELCKSYESYNDVVKAIKSKKFKIDENAVRQVYKQRSEDGKVYRAILASIDAPEYLEAVKEDIRLTEEWKAARLKKAGEVSGGQRIYNKLIAVKEQMKKLQEQQAELVIEEVNLEKTRSVVYKKLKAMRSVVPEKGRYAELSAKRGELATKFRNMQNDIIKGSPKGKVLWKNLEHYDEMQTLLKRIVSSKIR